MKASTIIAAAMLAATLSAQSAESQWKSLFDGNSLTGWAQKNGSATYTVHDGTILGTTAVGSPNSFLCSESDYGNFELEFEVKVDCGLNSGVQIRSRTKETSSGERRNDRAGRVFGPQVEIECGGAKGAEAGYIYGEATGRGWLTPKDQLKPHTHFKDGQWNQFRIVANGPRIRTWINGHAVEDLSDAEAYKTHPTGFIGLQVHGIGKNKGPFQVAWRHIRVRELPATK